MEGWLLACCIKNLNRHDGWHRGWQICSEQDWDCSQRKFGLGGGGGGDDDTDSDGSGLKLRPTFGVSFGLPSGGAGGGYPINPYSPNPAVNPYFGSVGGNGLDLGLVNVNPLLSVQVTKDEYGEKVVKPLVNLHVTPNHGLIHKVGNIFHKFKEPGYGGYGGYGGHGGYGYPPPLHHQHHHQHFHTPPPPPIYHKPPYYTSYKPYGPPRPYIEPYAPSFGGFRTGDSPYIYDNDYKASSSFGPSYEKPSSSYGPSYTEPEFSPSPSFGGYNDNYGSNYYDGPGSYDTDYYRSSNISAVNSDPSSSSSKDTKSNLVQFPSDRRIFGDRQKREAEMKENEVVKPEKVRLPQLFH